MKVVISHPTGNRNVREVLAALIRSGKLSEFHTTLAADPEAGWLNFVPAAFRKEWLRRTYMVPADKLVSHPLLEIARMILPRIGFKGATRHETGFASVDAVYRHFDRAVADGLSRLAQKEQLSAVYAYEDGALETFKQAKKLGLTCIYDLPIAYWETGRELMMEEAERLPEWANTLGGGIKDSRVKLERKTHEMELADVVVGPGSFVLDSIPDWAKSKKLIMSPFGSPSADIMQERDLKSEDRPMRVLFAGSMGQRKGLGDLFRAVKLIGGKDIELVVMGAPLAPAEFYRKQLPEFVFEPGRPNEQVLALMRSCDVFCLPSIVEGRALVMQEAMSQGLPLIITPNTGGADLIIEGETGFLVPIRSPESIAEKLTWLLANRSAIPEMGKLAQKHAKKYTWDNYGNTIVQAITGL